MRALGAAALAALLAGAGGCSFRIASILPEDAPATTSAIGVKAPATLLSSELGDEDWRRARAAMATALDPQGNGAPVNWDNPVTTMRGSFAADGPPFVQGDEICRAFAATLVGQGGTSSLHGRACRPSGGEWVVKTVAPRRKAA